MDPNPDTGVPCLWSSRMTSIGIRTVIAVVLTTNPHLAEAPGNVLVSKDDTMLPRDSVAQVSQVITIDKVSLTDRVSRVSDTAS